MDQTFDLRTFIENSNNILCVYMYCVVMLLSAFMLEHVYINTRTYYTSVFVWEHMQ